MEIAFLVCAILVTVAIITGTVLFVMTLIQVRQTAKEVEGLVKKFNAASPVLDLLVMGAGLLSSLTSKIRMFFGR